MHQSALHTTEQHQNPTDTHSCSSYALQCILLQLWTVSSYEPQSLHLGDASVVGSIGFKVLAEEQVNKRIVQQNH